MSYEPLFDAFEPMSVVMGDNRWNRLTGCRPGCSGFPAVRDPAANITMSLLLPVNTANRMKVLEKGRC